MNRRGFIATLLKATAGATVAYSFPSIIVPQNIVPVSLVDIFPVGLAYPVNDSDDWLAQAQREMIAGTIEALHRHKSDFLNRLVGDQRPLNIRGHSVRLDVQERPVL